MLNLVSSTILVLCLTATSIHATVYCWSNGSCQGPGQSVYSHAPIHDCNSYKIVGQNIEACTGFTKPTCTGCEPPPLTGGCFKKPLPCYIEAKS